MYHVMANIGGMYLERPTKDRPKPAYTFVEKDKQRRALQFLLDEALSFPRWLFDNDLSRQTFIQRSTPKGVEEQEAAYVLRNEQNYILWDLLDNARLIRMYENEMQNGTRAFTAVELMDMLHRHIFRPTLSGKSPDVMERRPSKELCRCADHCRQRRRGLKINKNLDQDALSSGSARC
jgi:hypothetical protein